MALLEDHEFGATVAFEYTRKQILVRWERKDGTLIDRRCYPRTVKGAASAGRTLQKRIDEGYLFPCEEWPTA